MNKEKEKTVEEKGNERDEKKNRKKALWRHEFRIGKWFILAGCVIALFGSFYACVMTKTEAVSFYINDYINCIVTEAIVNILTVAAVGLFFGIPFMTALQYAEQKVKNTGEFMHSLPVSKGRLLKTKVFAGIVCITVPCIIYLIGSLVVWNYRIGGVRLQYLSSMYYKMLMANDTVQNVIANVLMFWLMAIALYALSLVVQTMIKPYFIAMVVTYGVAMMPYYFVSMIIRIGEANGYSMVSLYDISDYVNLWCGNSLAQTSGIYVDDINTIELRVFENPWISVILYLTIIVVSALIVWRYHTRQQLEDSKHFIVSKPMNYFFKICVSVCIAIGLLGIRNKSESNIPFLILMFIFLSVFVYWVLDRAIKRYE